MKKTPRPLFKAASLMSLLLCSVVTAAASSRDTNGEIAKNRGDSAGILGRSIFTTEAGQTNTGLIIALVILAVLAVAAIVTAVLLKRSKQSRYMLRSDSGPLKGQIFPIKEGTVKIGRNTECAVRFPEGTKGVSRIHCAVTCTKGSLTIADLGSSAGTFLNKKGQVTKTPMSIHVGQSFYLGEQTNMFTIIQK